MNDRQLYVRVRGKVTGPVGFQQLKSLRDRGQFRRCHEISDDRERWVCASTISELFPGTVQEGSPGSQEIPPAASLTEPPEQTLSNSNELILAPVRLLPDQGSPGTRHSVMGIATTIGAGVMFAVILIFMQICQSQ